MNRNVFDCVVLAVILALVVFSLLRSVEPLPPRPQPQPPYQRLRIVIPVPSVPERIQGPASACLDV